MSHDFQLIIYGAAIGLASSLITTYFQFWLNQRVERKKREEKRAERYNEIQIATSVDIERFIDKQRDGMFEHDGVGRNISLGNFKFLFLGIKIFFAGLVITIALLFAFQVTSMISGVAIKVVLISMIFYSAILVIKNLLKALKKIGF